MHLLGSRPVEDEFAVRLLQLLPRIVEREATQLGHGGDQAVEVLAPGPRPRGQGSLGQGLGGVGHHEVGIDLVPGAQPRTGRAGAIGRVEREVPRGRVLEAQPAVGAGQVLAEGDGLLLGAVGVDHHDLGHALGQRQRRLERFGEPPADVVPADQAIDHHLDGVLLVAGHVEVGAVGQLDHGPVHPGPGEPLLGQVAEQGAVLTLATADHGGQDHEAGALVHGQDAVDDLLGALPGHRPAAVGAVGLADPGVEQPEVVVDLGDRAHRGPRVP